MQSTQVTDGLKELERSAVEAISAWLRDPSRQRTERLKAVSKAFIQAREHFSAASGEPDWLGRTRAYRDWVGRVVGSANVPSSERVKLLTSIRYHSGNALRQVLPQDKLLELGLLEKAPAQRERDRYSVKAEEVERLRLALATERDRADRAEAALAEAADKTAEVWGVVLDDFGSMDYYDTLAEAREWARTYAEIVHVVTYKVSSPTSEATA